jgi:hypothetical protein
VESLSTAYKETSSIAIQVIKTTKELPRIKPLERTEIMTAKLRVIFAQYFYSSLFFKGLGI